MNKVSPISALLIDRTVGMLMTAKPQASGPMLSPATRDMVDFVAVAPLLIGAEIRDWVMLTRGEFMQMFGPQNVLQ